MFPESARAHLQNVMAFRRYSQIIWKCWQTHRWMLFISPCRTTCTYEMMKRRLLQVNIFSSKNQSRGHMPKVLKLVQMAEKAGVKLAVNYQYRYDAACFAPGTRSTKRTNRTKYIPWPHQHSLASRRKIILKVRHGTRPLPRQAAGL